MMVLCIGEVMVCVLDFKRDVGLWHGVLTVLHLSPSHYFYLRKCFFAIILTIHLYNNNNNGTV